MKRILVLPGGGAKGTLQLYSICHLEKLLNCKVSEYFDLIVGTSVGGINGAVMSSGLITASDYYPQFKNVCRKTFVKNYLTRPPLLRPIYSRSYIQNFAYQMFGNGLMNSSKTKLMITAVSECDERTHFFKSWELKDGREPIVDVISRTYAAPFYFGHVIDDENRQVWLDGATGVNNDATDFAYVEAGRQGWDEFSILVIGTGYSKNDTDSFQEAKDSSQLSQILKYVSPVSGGLARVQFEEQQKLRYETLAESVKGFSYNYVNVEIPKSLDKMDAVSYLNDYEKYGDNMNSQLDEIFKKAY